MPRAPRTPDEVENIRRHILDAAMEIMLAEGFAALSMRGIASRLSMTAANIYNYFSNKDEIYLAIQTRGFETLVKQFSEIAAEAIAPRDKLKAMIRAYLDFGLTHADQYEIMFTRNTPKYADYVGTPLEPVATVEKETALQVAEIAARVGSELGLPDPVYRTLRAWTALHGIVSLANSRVLQEADENAAESLERLIRDLTDTLLDGT